MEILEASIQFKVLKSLLSHQSMKSTRVITKVLELNSSSSVVALGSASYAVRYLKEASS